jgi:hypothetical protein
MRVTDCWNETETEAFISLSDGRATILGGCSMDLGDFYRAYRVTEDRRNGDRRETRERRRIPSGARRVKSRRRVDCLTRNERMALCLGIEYVQITEPS